MDPWDDEESDASNDECKGERWLAAPVEERYAENVGRNLDGAADGVVDEAVAVERAHVQRDAVVDHGVDEPGGTTTL